MARPNLLVIGAMKAGTSTLWSALSSHPDVGVASTKELHFFDRSPNWRQGPGWYGEQFGDDTPVRLDATPAYTRFPQWRDIPARASLLVPDAKLVYVLRDPVERIRSHFLHELWHGREQLPFERAVLEHATYLDTSRYAMQLEQWQRYYAPDRILVLYTEDMRRDPAATLAGVVRFAGLDPDVPLDLTDRNVTANRRARRPGVRRMEHTRVGKVARRAMPARRVVRAALKPFLEARLDADAAVLTPELRVVLADALRSDLLRLDTLLDDGHDRWGLLAGARVAAHR